MDKNQEVPPEVPPASNSRRACLEDFFGTTVAVPESNLPATQNVTIAKHQRDFGLKKRIKP